MPVKVLATANKCPSWESVKKRIDDRRAVLENARNMNIARLNSDVERIAKREIEFARQLFEEIVPFKFEVDNEAMQKIKEYVPVRVVPNKATPSPPVVDKTAEIDI